MSVSNNQTLTVELISQLIAGNTASLRSEIASLRSEFDTFTNTDTVTEYVIQNIDETLIDNEPLDIVKSLPEFNGSETYYVSWREAAHNSIKLYKKGSRRYFAALTILRNKITGIANDSLTNHGTVLNFDAIISRLDFAYADKRPLHIIEQELSILRQGTMTILDYYNAVNKMLTTLINKTIMTHGSNNSLTNEINQRHRQNALRVFTTGLNPPLANILFSLSPEDLPNALAKAQELESNNLRANFALQFSRSNNPSNKPQNHLRHPQKQQQGYKYDNQRSFHGNYPKHEKQEPMEVDTSIKTKQNSDNRIQNKWPNQQPYYNNNDNAFGRPIQHFQQNRPNLRNYGEKRQYRSVQASQQPQIKTQRVNNLNEQSFLYQDEDCPTFLGQSEEPKDQ